MTTVRPRLAVVCDADGAVLPMARAFRRFCDVIWVVSGDPGPNLSRYQRLGEVVEAADGDPRGLERARPDGIVAFKDTHLERVSRLGEALGLRVNPLPVARQFTDKRLQRAALREAGLPTPATATINPADPADRVRQALAGLRWPLVVKPAISSGSRQTIRAETLAEVLAHLATFPPSPRPEDFVAEEMLQGEAGARDPAFSDQVAVEMLFVDGAPTTVGVTATFSMVEPFRETGSVVPCPFDADTCAGAAAVASRAALALGARWGAIHTEVKLTPDGPRVIEVNGRVAGGVICELYEAAGVPLRELAARAVLPPPEGLEGGRIPTISLLAPGTAPYHFSYHLQPPCDASRVRSVGGLEELRSIPGVAEVALNRLPGDPVDWRRGFYEHVVSVRGTASGHSAVAAIPATVARTVAVTYGPV